MDNVLVLDIDEAFNELLNKPDFSNVDVQAKHMARSVHKHQASLGAVLEKNGLDLEDSSRQYVMDFREFHDFVRHVGLFKQLENGKGSPAAIKKRNIMSTKKVVKYKEKPDRALRESWECVSQLSRFKVYVGD